MLRLDIEVPDVKLDKEYKHLHHADALRLLEQARLKLLEEIGFPNSRFLAENLFIVLSGINAKYLREVKAGMIQAVCKEIRFEASKRFIIIQSLYNERGKLAISAEVECAFLDGETKRAIDPPAYFKTAAKNFFSK